MNRDIENYLKEVHSHLHLDSRTEKKILKEIYTHLEDTINENENYISSDVSYDKLAKRATESLGDPREIATLMYREHSRASWEEVILHFQPYLLFGSLFGFHLWHSFVPLSVTFLLMAAVTFAGIRKGIGNWMFSWAGLLFGGITAFAYLIKESTFHEIGKIFYSVFGGRGYFSFPSLIGLLLPLVVILAGLSIVTLFALRLLQGDWIPLSSVMMPLPLFLAWAYVVNSRAPLYGWLSAQMAGIDGIMVWVFLVCGFLSALSIAVGVRKIKVLTIFLGIFASLFLFVLRLDGVLNLYVLLVLFLSSLAIVLVPFLLYNFFFKRTELDMELAELPARLKAMI